MTNLPHIITSIGWISVAFGMIGAILNATLRQRLLRYSFMIWIGTNCFDVFVNAYFYHNWWITTQFSFYLCTAIFGFRRSLNMK